MNLRGFGFIFDVATGRIRNWYVGTDGVQRWIDNDKPVNPSTESAALTAIGSKGAQS